MLCKNCNIEKIFIEKEGVYICPNAICGETDYIPKFKKTDYDPKFKIKLNIDNCLKCNENKFICYEILSKTDLGNIVFTTCLNCDK